MNVYLLFTSVTLITDVCLKYSAAGSESVRWQKGLMSSLVERRNGTNKVKTACCLLQLRPSSCSICADVQVCVSSA